MSVAVRVVIDDLLVDAATVGSASQILATAVSPT